jgi:hypothetical protein
VCRELSCLVGVCAVAFAESRLVACFEILILYRNYEGRQYVVIMDFRICLPAGVNRQDSTEITTNKTVHCEDSVTE